MKSIDPVNAMTAPHTRPDRNAESVPWNSSASVEELLAALLSDGHGQTQQPPTAGIPSAGSRVAAETAGNSIDPDRRRTASRSQSADDVCSVPMPSLVSGPLARELTVATADCQSLDEIQAAVAGILQEHASLEYVGWYIAGGSRIGEPATLKNLTCDTAEPDESQQALLRQVAAQFGNDNRHGIAAAAVSALPGQAIVGVAHHNAAAPDMAQQTAVALAAAQVSQWCLQQRHAEAIADNQHVAALVELIAKVAACRSAAAAGKCLVDELHRYLRASDVALGQCRDFGPKCHLTAVASLPDVDVFGESTQLAEAVLQESIARNVTSVWPATENGARHSLLSHQHFATQHNATAVVSTPLRNADGQCVGAIMARFDDADAAATACRFLFAGERSVAAALAAADRSEQTLSGRLKSSLRRVYRSVNFRIAAVLSGVLSLSLLVPVDYRVTCESELQPVSRRFVAAPFAAPLERCLVEPGDVVQTRQLLAVLDGRELRWELAGVRADLAKANKEHNAYLSEQKFGEAAIARHEIERLQNQADVLTERTRNLEVRSPMAGVIVAGDLKETEGVPLETGQALFEVAPLDRMLVEVAIPEADVRHVSAGMTLRLRLDAARSESIMATIQRLHPAATLRDHENVFMAEAEVVNHNQQLRPGMKGTAKVSTGRRALGWNLFHKPVAEIVGWLGW